MSASIASFTSSSRKVSIPQSVWCISTTSRVPSRRWEITSDRIHIVGDHTAGISYHVRVAFLNPKQLVGVEARVHTRHNRHVERRRQWQVGFVKALGILGIVLEDVIRSGHQDLLILGK